ncbi:MAG: SUMF1/EgtB/PvdO family nonheme iron enzyme [Phycisphaeraceae bacterium]|nr:SUMF1/EgtB/PvdO family nonheme iron enzyme [Phycisphaeraceae bacterium]
MKKFLIGAVIAIALLAGIGGLVVGGLAYKTAFENQAVTDVNVEVETDLSEVAGYTPVASDRVVGLKSELQGGNTKLVWETGKVQAGSRYDFDGTWTSLGGAVVYEAEADAIKALEVVIVIESFNKYGSEHPAPGGMINVVLGKGTPPPTGFDPWFNTADHPEATFAATEFVAKAEGVTTDFENAPEGWTHLIKGTFNLNGVEETLELPAVVTFGDGTLWIETNFQISRAAFGVEPKNPLPGSTVDDIIELTATVSAKPDAGVEIGALSAMITEQSTKIVAQEKMIADLSNQLAMIGEALASLERKVASGVASAPEVDVANLPKTYTDQVQYPEKDPVQFEMVLVPGGDGVTPFYMAKHEVTWDMFYNWAYGSDVNANQYAELQTKNLRPSPLYEDCNQLKLGLGKRPALSMSRTTAEAFAKWVSEQTGKAYRVPTDAEWQHALKLGGGVPDSQEDLFKQAVFIDNAEIQFDPPFLELTDVVGTKEANALGIHDMLGNAAEWVVDTGADRVVRGGHFMLKVESFNPDWKGIEDQEIWNETYPQLPVSKFWYRDHYYQGIRLVADVQ